jgi:cold shock CspA family protein
MQVPLELSFRDVDRSEAIEELVREKVGKLEQVCNYMSSCRVAIEQPHRRRRTGDSYLVRLNVTVPPGHEVVVKQESKPDDSPRELHAAVREAFDVARRQLKDLVERQRDEVKVHEEQQVTALVSELYPEDGWGLLRTPEGREIYFQRNAVINQEFDRLAIGTGVRYVEQMGEKGPRATTVQIIEHPNR